MQFDDVLPGRPTPTWSGVSLQLIDSHQDNWRAGNWKTGQTNGSPAHHAGYLKQRRRRPADLRAAVDQRNRAGQYQRDHQQRRPTRPLAGTLQSNAPTPLSLTNLYLSTNYTDLTNWAFPSGAAINPGQFLVVFADGQTNLSTVNELHTSFTLNATNGSVALSRLYNGQPQVLDYVNYNNIQTRLVLRLDSRTAKALSAWRFFSPPPA